MSLDEEIATNNIRQRRMQAEVKALKENLAAREREIVEYRDLF
jgi:hypothetical protein